MISDCSRGFWQKSNMSYVLTCVLSLESVPWGRTFASGFNQTYTNQRRPLIPHQPWPCPWVTASTADVEPGSRASSEEREPRLEDTCWGDDKWTPWEVTVCLIPAGASSVGMIWSYRAIFAALYIFAIIQHAGRGLKRLLIHLFVLFPVVLFSSPLLITKLITCLLYRLWRIHMVWQWLLRPQEKETCQVCSKTSQDRWDVFGTVRMWQPPEVPSSVDRGAQCSHGGFSRDNSNEQPLNNIKVTLLFAERGQSLVAYGCG